MHPGVIFRVRAGHVLVVCGVCIGGIEAGQVVALAVRVCRLLSLGISLVRLMRRREKCSTCVLTRSEGKASCLLVKCVCVWFCFMVCVLVFLREENRNHKRVLRGRGSGDARRQRQHVLHLYEGFSFEQKELSCPRFPFRN